MKDILTLANGTTVELENGATLGSMKVVFADKASMVETWDMFTDENLKSVNIANSSGAVIAEYTDLVCASVKSTEQEDGTILTVFELRQKTEVELLKEALAQQKEETYMLTECVLEMSTVVYG